MKGRNRGHALRLGAGGGWERKSTAKDHGAYRLTGQREIVFKNEMLMQKMKATYHTRNANISPERITGRWINIQLVV